MQSVSKWITNPAICIFSLFWLHASYGNSVLLWELLCCESCFGACELRFYSLQNIFVLYLCCSQKKNTVTLIMNNLLGFWRKSVEIHSCGFGKGDSRRTEGAAFKYCWNRAQTWKHLWLSLASLIMQMLSVELRAGACSEASDCWSSKFTSVYTMKFPGNNHPSPLSFFLQLRGWNLQ